MTLIQWFHMQGYALYVWPAYGLVVGVLSTNILSIHWRTKRTRRALKRTMKI